MGIAADTGNAFEGEVEWSGCEAGAGKKRDQEGAKAGIDVEWDPLAEGKTR